MDVIFFLKKTLIIFDESDTYFMKLMLSDETET